MIEIPGYTLMRPLGRGGMGEVHLAVQQSLGREVALKLLTEQLSKDPVACERFVREARIAANLHHPHIVPIYDVGVQRGVAYIAMEYEPGGTAAGSAHAGVDPVTALKIARDIADALDYAHRQGVIHRDVKPENVLRRADGLCLLSDFGISRAVEMPTILTHEGASVGTPQYMSPEQLRGQDIDGRSDLYSLGVVLYQLLTGALPYSGSDSYVLGMQHINAPIPRLPENVGYLQPLIDSLMAKEPSARPQTGAEVVSRIDALLAGTTAALTQPLETIAAKPSRRIGWMTAGAAAALLALGAIAIWHPWRAAPADPNAPSAASIAVLPFVNMSADPAQEFFSDGISEELLNRLAQYSDLKVAARTSAFQFKGKNLDIADIGQKLKVARVLEGSVRRDGPRLRITAQLIDSTSGYHLWSETYERDATEVFKVQDEIATAIATALEAKLRNRPVAATPAKPVDPAAYEDYLQGRAFAARRVDDNIKLAVDAYDRAIARDPSYSPAHSGRAVALTLSVWWKRWLPLEEAFARARAAADEALRLDPGNAEAYVAQGTTAYFTHRIMDARRFFERAYALAPGSVDVLNFYGGYLMWTGDARRAERMERQALALDPLAFVHAVDVSSSLFYQGRFSEAAAMAERATALGAGVIGHNITFWMQLRLRQFEAAERSMQAACRDRVDFMLIECQGMNAVLLAATGHRQEADPWLAKLAEPEPGTDSLEAYSSIAALYANEIVDIPKATAAGRRSMQGINSDLMRPLLAGPHGATLPEEISQDPDWLALWNDPRLRELMDAYRTNVLAGRKAG